MHKNKKKHTLCIEYEINDCIRCISGHLLWDSQGAKSLRHVIKPLIYLVILLTIGKNLQKIKHWLSDDFLVEYTVYC